MIGPTPSSETRSLVRGLGLLDATSLVLGGVIGVSILLVPADVADLAGTPALALTVWAVAGVLAVFAAMCFAELGAAIPRTGGTYAFLRRAYPGTPVAFLFAWMMFFAYATAAIAVVAIMASTYVGQIVERYLDHGPRTAKAIAVGIVLGLTVTNYFGVRLSGRVQAALTILKVGVLTAIVASALVIFEGPGQPMTPIVLREAPAPEVAEAFGAAMVLALFSYSGAYFITHVAEEVEAPERNIPRSIALSMGIVLVIYLLLNLSYIRVLPFETLRQSDRVAADVMDEIFGAAGGDFIAVVVVISAIGVLNAQLLNYPRIVFALARDRLFFESAGYVHPDHRSPSVAILLVGGIASLFVLAGTYRELLSFVGFVMHFFICLAVIAVIVLRRREPTLPRPYKVWGFPATPVIFLLVSAWYLGNLLFNRFEQTVVGIFIVLSGLPFYFYWQHKNANDSAR